MAAAIILPLIAFLPGVASILVTAGSPAARAAGLPRGSGSDAASQSTSYDINFEDDDYEEAPPGEPTLTFRIRLSPTEMALHRAQGPYVVFTIFSGRRSYEEILLDYVRKLLKDGSVGEVLLTVLAGSSLADRDWLHDMRGSGEFSMEDIKMFSDVYKYLAMTWTPPEGRDNNTVVIKCDDDIVYVDLKHFGGFTRYIAAHQDMFIVFANTVNNQVAAHYQQLHGAIPNRSRGIDMEMPYPDNGNCGKLFEHPETAAELHNIFLQDPERFSWAAEENDGCIVYMPPGDRFQRRFSINFFGYRYSNREEVARLAASKFSDEVALTFDSPHTNCMYTEFVVAHYAFAIQRKALAGTDILDRYAKLRNNSV